MVELLEYDDQAHGEVDEFAEEDSEKFFFSYLSRSYEGFLAGADDEETQDAELQERFDLRNASVKNDVERLTEENGAMQVHPAAAAAAPAQLPLLGRRGRTCWQLPIDTAAAAAAAGRNRAADGGGGRAVWDGGAALAAADDMADDLDIVVSELPSV